MQGQRMLTEFLSDNCCSFAWAFVYAFTPRMQPTCKSQPLCVFMYIYVCDIDCHYCLLTLQGSGEFRALFSSFHLSCLISYIGRRVVVWYKTTLQRILHSATRTEWLWSMWGTHWLTYVSFVMKCYFVLYQQVIRTVETKQRFMNPIIHCCRHVFISSYTLWDKCMWKSWQLCITCHSAGINLE